MSGIAVSSKMVIHGDTVVTANYTQNEYTLAVVSAHGTVAKGPDQATYHYGDTVVLTATAEAGWTFADWTGDATGAVILVSVPIDATQCLSATLSQSEYTLTVVSAHGTVAKGPDR